MNSAPITKVVIKRFRSFPTATLAFANPLFVVTQRLGKEQPGRRFQLCF